MKGNERSCSFALALGLTLLALAPAARGGDALDPADETRPPPIRLGPDSVPPAPEAAPPAPPPPPETNPNEGKSRLEWGGFELGGFWIPVMNVFTPRHEGEHVFRMDDAQPDLRSGAGFGVRAAALGTSSADGLPVFSVGGLYEQTEHHDRVARGLARTHAAYLELGAHILGGDERVAGGLGLSAAVGGADIHFRRGFADIGAAALQLGVDAELRLFRRFSIEAGGFWYIWGYPPFSIGDADIQGFTLAEGWAVTLGGSFTF
jgi:hypothetical protein